MTEPDVDLYEKFFRGIIDEAKKQGSPSFIEIYNSAEKIDQDNMIDSFIRQILDAIELIDVSIVTKGLKNEIIDEKIRRYIS